MPMTIRVSDRYWCGGMTRLVGAGTPLKTRPARSNFDWWQGRRSRRASRARGPAGATSGRYVGEQPRCVQMPTAMQILGLDRAMLVLAVRAVAAARRSAGRRAARRASGSDSSIGFVRLIDPHDPAAPLERDLLAGLDLADVLLDRRAGGLRPLAREERHHERRRRRDPADPAHGARRPDEKAPLPSVDLAFPIPTSAMTPRPLVAARAVRAARRASLRKPVDYKGSAPRRKPGPRSSAEKALPNQAVAARTPTARQGRPRADRDVNPPL